MLYNRFYYLFLLAPFLFTLTGCRPEKKENATTEEKKEEVMKNKANNADVVLEIITDADFKDAFERGKPVIADFWAEWCGPCKAFKPIFHELAQQHSNEITFLSVNEKYRNKNGLMKKEGISAFPTIIFYDESGKIFKKHEGGYTPNLFKSEIQNLILHAKSQKGRP